MEVCCDSAFEYKYILCKINLAIVLLVSDPPYQAFIVTLLHQDTSAVHREGLPGEKSRMINRSVSTSVTSVFKISVRKGHF